LSPKLRSLIAKSYYAELVLSTPLLSLRHPSPHLLEEICGSVALVMEHDTFMPGEVVVDKYDPQILPRAFLYIVNNGSILIRRGSSIQSCTRSVRTNQPVIRLTLSLLPLPPLPPSPA
jgi:hypothetical protein